MGISDLIASFLQESLDEAENGVLEIQRNDLAQRFNCVPSQINYVLATRFSPDHGYIIESRRGGGGYIRIVRVVQTGAQRLMYLTNERIGDAISEAEAVRLIHQLVEQGLVSLAEGEIMRAAVSAQAMSVPIPDALKAALRARTLKTMLMTVARQNREGGALRG